MFARLIVWLLRILGRTRHEIGRKGDLYLERWELWGKRYGPGRKLFLHRFHRSDSDAALHDHPWDFWSLILWGGYWEHTPAPCRQHPVPGKECSPDDRGECYWCGESVPPSQKRWYGPGRLLRRPALWRHRVELYPGRGCWSLVWTGAKKRSWFFHCPQGPVGWKEFTNREDVGQKGCGG